MKQILRDVWSRDRRGFVNVLALNIAVALTSGISIAMLVPMLGLLDISDAAESALRVFLEPLQSFSESTQLVVMITIYFMLVFLKAILVRVKSIAQNDFLENYACQLREQLYRTVLGAKWEQLSAGRQADTVDLFTAQCGQVVQSVSVILLLISSIASALVSLGIAIWLSAPVTLFVLICGAAFSLLYRKLMKISKEFGDEMIRLNRQMYTELFHQLRGVKEVRSYGVQQKHAELFHEINEHAKISKLEFTHQSATPTMLQTIAAAGMIAVIFIVCVLVFHMDTARLIVLVYVFMRLWPAFSGVIPKIAGIRASIPAYEKLNEAFLNFTMENTVEESGETLKFEQEIEFRNVAFSYQGSQQTVLNGVNFVLKRGSILALVGRSGAGKTTIADLMLGLLSPSEGQILIDGVPLTEDNLSGWRHGLGYIPQEPLILNASVRENLERFHPYATQEQMIDALKKAHAWEVVEKLPNGLDTVLGDGGIRLSGGERQRLVLARVLMGNPRLIIMDEATSAMDYESEAAVRSAIAQLKGQTTVVIIAHRLATVRTAERVLVLQDGMITEDGTLQELAICPNGYLNKLLYMD